MVNEKQMIDGVPADAQPPTPLLPPSPVPVEQRHREGEQDDSGAESEDRP